MTVEAIVMMAAVFAVLFGGFVYTIYLSSKED